MTEQDYTPQVGDWVEVTIRGQIDAVYVSGLGLSNAGRHYYVATDETKASVKRIDPPLPTESGVYIPARAGVEDGPLVFVLYGGSWRMTPGGVAEDVARYWQERCGLVRLVPEEQS